MVIIEYDIFASSYFLDARTRLLCLDSILEALIQKPRLFSVGWSKRISYMRKVFYQENEILLITLSLF